MKYLFLILIASCSLLGIAQNTLPADVDKSIQDRITNGHSPSIVVGIIDKNGPQYYLYGTKTIGGEAVDEHSIYEIGSISKTFTGILLAQMVLNKKLNLEDPAQNYLPDVVKLPVRNGQQITIGQLSDHTSALPRMPSNFSPADPANPYADYSIEQLYAFLNNYKLSREIGSSYEYSNLAQGLLGQILSIKSGKLFEELMIQNIAKPLRMKETKISLDPNMKKHLAIGHSQGVPVANWDLPTLAGAGAIRSSLHDMLIYIGTNAGILKSKLYPAMQLSHTARHAKADNGTRVGLAWHIFEGAEGDVIAHSGGTGGYRTFAGFNVQTGKGVVVLTNSDRGADDIGYHLLNTAAKLIEVKKSAASELNKTLVTSGAESTLKRYEALKNNGANNYEFNESEINTNGYSLLNAGKIKEAIVLFKINMQEFPNSSNVYDSYAEALMKDGQQQAAIENYKKSLDLNPGNSNAVEMLSKMGVKHEPKNNFVDNAVLASYVGTYQLSPAFTITISNEGNQLFAQATGQSKFELFAKSATEFYLKAVEAQIHFTAVNGKVEKLTLYQGGRVIPGMRME
ncbi:MAG: serine hydrolase [Saprospiraceae bacterium]|nr:serine hydrolase [Saprospiraceae bacterium]MBK8298114.1 serine hydrolase [Saprospiraceae bacterium]